MTELQVYKLTVQAGAETRTVTCKTFDELSRAIDEAWKLPGFTGYRVAPGGDL